MFSRIPQMETIAHHLLVEGRALAERLGMSRPRRVRIVVIHVALLAAFGVFLPWQKGLDFLDPVMTTAYACLGVLFAAPVAAQAFTEGRLTSPTAVVARIVARILVAVMYGECMALMMLVAGVITVSATHRRLLLPVLDGLALGTALGVSASLGLASVAAWIALRFSASAARGAMRLIFILLLLAFLFRSRRLPDVAGAGALIGLVVTAVALLALRGLGLNRG